MNVNERPARSDTNDPPGAPGSSLREVLRRIYAFLASVRLAMALLVIILACCVAGVTVFRGDRSVSLIFGALWFNAILVLLVINVSFCFFGRIWGKSVTLVSLGMILFHLSFVSMLGGIIYNSLFRFEGLLRLTEEETLPSGDLGSYDAAEWGRFFEFSRLTGETTLVKVHTDYTVDGNKKKMAYEISVGREGSKQQGLVYITHSVGHDGIEYYRDREGYSLLIVLYDNRGRELYGAYVPLQSLKQPDDSYLYTTGTRTAPGGFPFPQTPLDPLFSLQAAYLPTQLKERAGDAVVQAWPLASPGEKLRGDPLAHGKAPIGAKIRAGDHYLSVKEVRYWVIMDVRYEPGKPIVLTSLWVGLGGMIMTFVGRLSKSKA